MTDSQKTAVIDGVGKSADVSLELTDADGECIKEIPWPKEWPSWVSRAILEKQGYEVIVA